MKNLFRFICTLNLPISMGHGTFGSLIGLFIAYLIRPYFITSLVVLSTITLVGLASIVIYDPKYDRKEIIIDEIIGQIASIYLSELIIYYLLGVSIEINSKLYILFLVFNFTLFRFFDIAKPWGIRYLEDNATKPYGIILDDLLAAIYSSIFSTLIVFFLINL